MPREQDSIQAQIEQSSGRIKGEKVVSPGGGDVVRPSFAFIREAIERVGLPNIASALDYHDALAKFHVGKAERIKGESKNNLRKFIQEQDRGSAEELNVLQQMEAQATGFTMSNSIREFQDSVSLESKNYKAEVPSMDGLWNHMVKFVGDQSSDILRRPMTPEARNNLELHLGNSADHLLASSFAEETEAKEALASIQLDDINRQAIFAIESGQDPGNVIDRLTPIVEATQIAYPKKVRLIQAMRHNIIDYSIKLQAKRDPNLAELNLKSGGLYKDLSAESRMQVHNIISARRVELAHEAALNSAIWLEREELKPGSSVNKLRDAVATGSVTGSDLVELESSLPRPLFRELASIVKERQRQDRKKLVQTVTEAYKHAQRGDYGFESADRQNEISMRYKNEVPAIGEDGNVVRGPDGTIMVEGDMDILWRAKKSSKRFTVQIHDICDEMRSALTMSKTAEQLTTAILAFRELRNSGSVILGNEKSAFFEEMSYADSALSLGIKPSVVMKNVQEMRGAMPADNLAYLTAKLKTEEGSFDVSVLQGMEGTSNLDPSNTEQMMFAKTTYERHYLSPLVNGNSTLAYRMTSADIATGLVSSCINGDSVKTHGFGYPEGYSGMNGQEIRKLFNKLLKQKIERISAQKEGLMHNIGSEFTVDSDDINSPEANYVTRSSGVNRGRKRSALMLYVPLNKNTRTYEVRWVPYTPGAIFSSVKISGSNIGYPLLDENGDPVIISFKEAMEASTAHEEQVIADASIQFDKLLFPSNERQVLDIKTITSEKEYPGKMEELLEFMRDR